MSAENDPQADGPSGAPSRRRDARSLAGDGPSHDAGLAAGERDVPVGAFAGEIAVASQPPGGRPEAGTGRHAVLVGAGILISRIVGLVRQRVFAHYFGTSDAADAFNAAFRIPNLLQNIFGEGALSASFIPVYAGLLGRDRREAATRVANAVFTLLALATSVLVLVGIATTPYLIAVIAPGFEGAKRDLTIRLVRIFFPGAGLLVLAAWCLGILNSHRRFFLSYTAPVVWNLAIIGALVGFGRGTALFSLAELVAWASVAGSALQFAVQLPSVLRLTGGLRPVIDAASSEVRAVVGNFLPVLVSRGVVQISAYVDSLLASLLGTGAVSALGYTQSLYTLPVSLFGMSVSAAELPAMSSAGGRPEDVHEQIRGRLSRGLRRIALFIVPSSMAFLALGDVVTAALYQTGRFTPDDVIYVWVVLAGSAVGLLASTLGRLYASTYYALHDTRTPLRFAAIRVLLTVVLGYLAAIPLPHALGIDLRWGAAGLTASAGIAGWVEFALLRRNLGRRVGRVGLSASYLGALWTAAALAAGIAWAVKLAAGSRHPVVLAALVLAPYGVAYFTATSLMRLPEALDVVRRARGVLTGLVSPKSRAR